MRALLFPGQGSQQVGMGHDLFHEYATAKAIFDEANEVLGYSLSNLCFSGPQDRLTRTENTQPAILTNSIAVLRTLEKERGLTFDMAAGHSLGEWSALVAAGALEFADALRLVHLRGKAMQEAVPEGQGTMAVILGLDLETLETLCAEAAQGEVVAPANINGGGQIVISGALAAVERAITLAKGRKARAQKLHVSAPFHCQLMQPAADRMAKALRSVPIAEPRVPVVANVDAQPNRQKERIPRLLVDQITSPVYWEDSVKTLVGAGATSALELGAGSVLRGLVRRIDRRLPVQTVGEPREVRSVELL